MLSRARRHPVISAVTVLAASWGAYWAWSERARRDADRVEIIALEGAADMTCDNLAFDLEQTATDTKPISVHDDVAWYAAFNSCVFPRELSNREHDDLVKGFRESSEKLLGQSGSDAAPTLRDLATRVKKVKAMHFRRTRKFE